MKSRVELTEEQRQTAWSVAREQWVATKGRLFPSIKRARKQLVGFGWEAIVISVVMKILFQLFLVWIKKKREAKEFQPSLAPPVGWAAGVHEFDDEDDELDEGD